MKKLKNIYKPYVKDCYSMLPNGMLLVFQHTTEFSVVPHTVEPGEYTLTEFTIRAERIISIPNGGIKKYKQWKEKERKNKLKNGNGRRKNKF